MSKWFVPKLCVEDVDYCNYCWLQKKDEGRFFDTLTDASDHLTAQKMSILYDLLFHQNINAQAKNPQILNVDYFKNVLRDQPFDKDQVNILLDLLFGLFSPIEIKKVEIE